MILLWGLASDAPLAAVRDALTDLEVPFIHLEQRDALRTTVEMEVATGVTGFVRSGSQVIDLAALTACYLRPDDSRQLQDVAAAGENSPAWQHALMLEDALLCWAEITEAFVVSRPSAMASNSSKPYQLELIRSYGMAVPDTLITTDPAAVLAFREEHGEIIYKSVSSVRSKVSKFRPEHLERIQHVTSCPTQFQQCITGADYRVHVVGDEVFATRLISTADDYRYADGPGEDLDVVLCEIPSELAESCRRVASGIGLPVAGLDLRRTSDDRWYCFEVNPSPGFTFYDRLPDQPIATAIARLLAGAPDG